MEAVIRIGILGSGYVGLVTGASFAAAGHHVLMVDLDPERVARLRDGETPFWEPGLTDLMAQTGDRLRATTDATEVSSCSVIFLAVPTPSAADGSCNTSLLLEAASDVAPHLADNAVLVVKSTAPVGTTEHLASIVRARTHRTIHVAMNPEFLREGSAVSDFRRPHRVVIGATSEAVHTVMRELYEPFVDPERPLIFTDPRTAELCKYAANAYLAMRIAWINEIAGLSAHLDADIDALRHVVGLDPRIGHPYLQPGPGYAGTCFPKDVRALAHMAQARGDSLHLVEATHTANQAHRARLVQTVVDALPSGRPARITLWGLAFKAHTDDVRESIALQLLERLAGEPVEVVVWDPRVGPRELGPLARHVSRHADTPLEAVDDADVVVLLTEWPELAELPIPEIAKRMRGTTLIDARNLLHPAAARSAGLHYQSVGHRAESGRPVEQTATSGLPEVADSARPQSGPSRVPAPCK